jgi:hypothetical protein
MDGESLNATSSRRFTRFGSNTELVQMSKFAQKLSEAEGNVETSTKLPRNLKDG